MNDRDEPRKSGGKRRKSGQEGDSGPRGGAGKRRRDAERCGRRRRNDRGQYISKVAEDDILDLLDTIPGPVITTTDVAETFDMTTEGARRKLNDLCDEGILHRRKSGQTRVYWRINGGSDV